MDFPKIVFLTLKSWVSGIEKMLNIFRNNFTCRYGLWMNLFCNQSHYFTKTIYKKVKSLHPLGQHLYFRRFFSNLFRNNFTCRYGLWMNLTIFLVEKLGAITFLLPKAPFYKILGTFSKNLFKKANKVNLESSAKNSG